MNKQPGGPERDLKETARLVLEKSWVRMGMLAFAVICMLAIPGLTLIGKSQQSEADIAASGLPGALQRLERTLGYNGFVHNFKNAVLRPDEPAYFEAAAQNYQDAITTLSQIEAMGQAIGKEFNVSNLISTLGIYRENLDTAQAAAAAGASIREVDALVRTPDEAATRDLDHLHRSVTNGLNDWLAKDLSQSRLQMAGLSALLFLVAVVLLMFLVSIYLARRERDRQSVELHDRLASLGQLTSGIAHDVNNLLATIYYAVDLTMAETIPDTSRKFLTSAQRAVERGQNLTARLLAFSRPQPGNAKTIEVSTLFRAVKELAEPQLGDSIRLRLSEEEVGLTLHCDQAQLENALLNLILNSRDALQLSGTGNTITLDARRHKSGQLTHTAAHKVIHPVAEENGLQPLRASDTGYLLLSLRDDGPGMPPEVRKRALEPFFTTKASQSGSGLGLSIVYGFAQSAGGDMQISSAPGEGTEVQLLLPCGQERPASDGASATDRAPGRAMPPLANRGNAQGTNRTSLNAGTGIGPVTGQAAPQVQSQSNSPVPGLDTDTGADEVRATVLLAEDEPGLRDLLVATLERKGFEVIAAENGINALKLATMGPKIDLLLTDIVMPGGVDGFELARSLRESFPDLPVLYLTGNAGPHLSSGIAVHAPVLRKPCPPDRLFEAIGKALTNRFPTIPRTAEA
ncbi:ATP-binding protein [Pseudooceanicola algae]|uniref:histidine kinase n=1 Tax=Pseudooceanicola algae TaxID=1537215 RepID=A0A418SJZ6_9RHOB|nr:ATP-binding protein [Pseudooceanicola algae]QPM92241.1 Sensor histidine kinase RcsC [Pseudooceanicola algae]